VILKITRLEAMQDGPNLGQARVSAQSFPKYSVFEISRISQFTLYKHASILNAMINNALFCTSKPNSGICSELLSDLRSSAHRVWFFPSVSTFVRNSKAVSSSSELTSASAKPLF
jgi:hypothetical protein